jgi:hypothetical protein
MVLIIDIEMSPDKRVIQAGAGNDALSEKKPSCDSIVRSI